MSTRSSRTNKNDNKSGRAASKSKTVEDGDKETESGSMAENGGSTRSKGKDISFKETSKRTAPVDDDSGEGMEEETGVSPRKLSCPSALTSPKGKSKINVGPAYQACLDEPATVSYDREKKEEEEWILWKAPTAGTLAESDYEEYLNVAKSMDLTLDRALFILMNSGYDCKIAKEQLGTRKVVREQWTMDDVVLFRQAFQFFGKCFKKIQLMLPHRSIHSLVDHYYHTKKTFKQSSLLEKMGVHFNDDDEDYVTMIPLGKGDFDNPPPDVMKNFVEKFQEGMCANCGHIVTTLLEVDQSKLCYYCFLYYEKHQRMRPTDFISALREEVFQKYYDCPEDYEDLAAQFEELCCKGDSLLENYQAPEESPQIDETDSGDTDIEVVYTKQSKCRKTMHDLHFAINTVKIRCHRTEHSLELGRQNMPDLARMKQIVKEYIPKKERSRIVPVWSEKERFFAFFSLIRYDCNFNAAAEIVGNKSPDMVKAFYMENKDKINDVISKQNKSGGDNGQQFDIGSNIVSLD